MKNIFNAKLAVLLLIIIIPANIFMSDDDPKKTVNNPVVKQNYMERIASAFMYPFKKITEDFFLSPNFFANNHIVAYYGHPNSKIMGILGRYSKEELAELVKKTAEKYRSINGEKGVVPAF